jgi:uncharacterized protein
MGKLIRAEVGKVIIAKLDYKSDLLEQLTEIAIANEIILGKIEAIGAVSRAEVGYYDQNEYMYEVKTFDEHLEIISLLGNISIRDGKPVIHAHISLSDENGKAIGGHLVNGTMVFACEAIITVYKSDKKLIRGVDENTKLPLWM